VRNSGPSDHPVDAGGGPGEGHPADENDAGGGETGTMDEIDLTPEEKMAFERLPREAEPSRILEERVVRSLREEGVLKPGKGAEHGSKPAGHSGGRGLWRGVAAAAAVVVLFGSGVAFGERMGSRSTAHVLLEVREQDAAQLALRIQEAGSAYVAALAALGELDAQDHGGDPLLSSAAGLDRQQGREVALGALYAAANELARMNPGDEDVLRVLQILEQRRAREEGRLDDDRNTVWF